MISDITFGLFNQNQTEIEGLIGIIDLWPEEAHSLSIAKTSYPVDLFVARASLQPPELVRIFSPTSPYRHAQLIYFASRHWQPDINLAPYITQDKRYETGDRVRRLIFFSGTPQS